MLRLVPASQTTRPGTPFSTSPASMAWNRGSPASTTNPSQPPARSRPALAALDPSSVPPCVAPSRRPRRPRAVRLGPAGRRARRPPPTSIRAAVRSADSARPLRRSRRRPPSTTAARRVPSDLQQKAAGRSMVIITLSTSPSSFCLFLCVALLPSPDLGPEFRSEKGRKEEPVLRSRTARFFTQYGVLDALFQTTDESVQEEVLSKLIHWISRHCIRKSLEQNLTELLPRQLLDI